VKPSPLGLAALLLVSACAWFREAPPVPAAPEVSEFSRPFELPALAADAEYPELVAFVSVSALTPDAYAGAQPTMPTLARLADAGVAAGTVEPVAPAARAPAHATLVTGRRPAAHRIPSDRLIGERGVRRAGYTHASHLRGPTLWSAAAEQKRGVAALGWPTTVGAAIPLLLPDVAASRRRESWLVELADKSTPWLFELAAKGGGDAPDTVVPGPARDATLVGVACELVGSSAPPTLLMLHLGQTRAAVALYGPGTFGSRAAFASADAQIERLLVCLEVAGRLRKAALVVAGDYGALPAHTALAPNAVLEAAGLLSRADDEPGLRGWRALARSNGGSAFVYARTEGDALRARQVLRAEAEKTGFFRVVSAEEMLALGADPEAWFGLEAQPGYVFVDRAEAPLLATSALRGVGGYLPGRAEMGPGFVAWGRGLRTGVRVPWMRQIDVAPTVARLLGIELDDSEGRVLVGVLNLPPGTIPVVRPPWQDEMRRAGWALPRKREE
jgi:predicted AlkP superfamily pyrophosphatase or phosphodiesterase